MLEARQEGATPARLVPTLRARVTGVRGRDVNLEGYADVRGRGSLAREYTVTYRPDPRGERRGDARASSGPRSRRPAPGAEQEVSIEQSIHERFGINVGDRMRFDVAGRAFEARVTSVRRVRWEDARSGGFMFVFRPGALGAGAAHLRRLRARPGGGRRARTPAVRSRLARIRTSAPSTPATSSPASRRSSTTSCSRSPSSAASRSPAAS